MRRTLDGLTDLSRIYVVACPRCGYREPLVITDLTGGSIPTPQHLVWSTCPRCGRPARDEETALYFYF